LGKEEYSGSLVVVEKKLVKKIERNLSNGDTHQNFDKKKIHQFESIVKFAFSIALRSLTQHSAVN